MEFEFYRNFITVTETRNLTLAAEKLSLAQPALTAQIRTLEAHYGVKLVETARGRRTLTLTDAGVDFLSRAKEICETENSLNLEMAGYNQKVKGTLRFGISFNVAIPFMYNFLEPFAKANPEINIHMRELTTTEQIEGVKKGTIDFGYANAPMPELPDFSYKKIKQELFYAVYARNNNFHFYPKDTVTIAELKDLPLATNYGTYGLLRKLCLDEGFTPKISFISDNGYNTAHFATTGTAVAIVSDNCCEKLPPNMTRTIIDNLELTYAQTLFWCHTQRLTPAIKSFLQFIKEK